MACAGWPRWRLLLARSTPYLSLFAIDFAAGAVNPLLTFLTRTDAEFADVAAAGAVAVALGNIASGYLAGVASIRWVLTAWMLIAAVSNAVTASAPSFGVLLLCRIAANVTDPWSLTQTLIDPNGSSAAVTGRATAAVLAGRVGGGVLGGVMTQFVGWRETCYLCSAVLVAAAVIDWALIPSSTRQAQALLRARAEDDEPVVLAPAPLDSPQAQPGPIDSPTAVALALEEEGPAERGDEDTTGLLHDTTGLLHDDVSPAEATTTALEERDVAAGELRGLVWKVARFPGFWLHTSVLIINGLVCGTLNTTVPSTLKNAYNSSKEFVQYTVAADTACRSFASAVLLPLLSRAVREPWRSSLLAVALAAGVLAVWLVPAPLWPFVVVNSIAFTLQSVHQSAGLAAINAYVVSPVRQLRGVVKGFAFAVFVGGISVGSFFAERILGQYPPEALWMPLLSLAAACAVLNQARPVQID
jgi:predicted MFS family arabinose efflux permease